MKKLLLMAAGLAMTLSATAKWGTTIDEPTPLFPTGTISYATEVRPAPDGSVWGVIYNANTKDAEDEYDIDNVVYEYRLQHWDKDGNPTFPEEGLMISDFDNLSFTVVNNYLLVDHEGNAIVSVTDCRNSSVNGRSYTAYKISPKGELLWGEDGVALTDPLKPADFAACMNIVELDDHSFVFAWIQGDDSVCHTYMQRLTADGKPQWDLEKVAITDDISDNPILVSSLDNTCILLYTRGSSGVLYARKVDFEGENVWGKDVRIYRGGWGSMPTHIYFTGAPSGDGGLLATWFDDRNNTNLESPYISYITSDGEVAFLAASDEGDVKLAYNQNRNFCPFAVPAADGSCFYVVWRTTDGVEYNQGVMMQKVSKEGELLWGDDARFVAPFDENAKNFTSIQAAGESDAVCFWEEYRSYFDNQCYATRFNGEGEFVWNDGNPVILSRANRGASALQSYTIPGQKAYIYTWTDGGTSETDDKTTYFMARLNEDGTLGLPGSSVKGLESENQTLWFDGTALRSDLADGSEIAVYSVAGMKVADAVLNGGAARVELPSGMYVANVNGERVKFVVK